MSVHRTVSAVTEKIIARSKTSRKKYLEKIERALDRQPRRKALGCANIAHGFAACGAGDKNALRNGSGPNLAIVTSYNDMLSAHQPFEFYPDLIRQAARVFQLLFSEPPWRDRLKTVETLTLLVHRTCAALASLSRKGSERNLHREE